MLRLPDPDRVPWQLPQRVIAARAAEDHRLSKRWTAFAGAMMDERA
jgi:hypothetical protein